MSKWEVRQRTIDHYGGDFALILAAIELAHRDLRNPSRQFIDDVVRDDGEPGNTCPDWTTCPDAPSVHHKQPHWCCEQYAINRTEDFLALFADTIPNSAENIPHKGSIGYRKGEKVA